MSYSELDNIIQSEIESYGTTAIVDILNLLKEGVNIMKLNQDTEKQQGWDHISEILLIAARDVFALHGFEQPSAAPRATEGPQGKSGSDRSESSGTPTDVPGRVAPPEENRALV